MNEKTIKGLEKIAHKFDLKLLILFGSRAKGTEKTNSDYDLAYFPPFKFTIKDEMKLFDEIISFLKDEKVDLINLKTTNKLHVANNIFQTGKVIYEKETGFFDQKKWDAWMDLQDFSKYYDLQLELTKKSLTEMIKNE